MKTLHHGRSSMKLTTFTLLLVNSNSSPWSFLHERICPPCKLTWMDVTQQHQYDTVSFAAFKVQLAIYELAPKVISSDYFIEDQADIYAINYLMT